MERPEDKVIIPYGTRPLDEAREFTGRILHAPDYALDVLTCIIAATHTLDSWNAVPRVLATSPEGQSGKTTLLNAIRLLATTWNATNASSYALKSKFSDRGQAPVIMVDEVSDIFGKDGRRGSSNPVGTIARDGYLRNATVSVSRSGTTEDVPAFCFMAMAGLRNAVPNDIYTRCIDFKMKPVPEGIVMEDALDPDTEVMASDIRVLLHAYTRTLLGGEIRKIQRTFKAPHPRFRDRMKQIWLPAYATALASDRVEMMRYEIECERRERLGLPAPGKPACDWAGRILTAFKEMALDAADLPVLTSEQNLLKDAARYARRSGANFIVAADLRDWLRTESENQLWDKLTDRRLAILMTDALGPNTVRAVDGTRKARGWYAAPVVSSWDALDASLTPAQAAEEEPDESELFDDVATENGVGNSHHGKI